MYLSAYTPDAWIDVYYVIFVVDPNYTEPSDPVEPDPTPDPEVITEEVDIEAFAGQQGYQNRGQACFEFWRWAINLGEYDLSKYSQVIIGYGYDAFAESVAQGFAAAPSLPIGFKSTNTSFGWNGDALNMEGEIVSAQMEYVGGIENSFRDGNHEAVIDLTDVDYKGDLYLTVYNPDCWIEVYYVIFVR